MQKISFEPEDFPPLSYYLKEDDDECGDGEKRALLDQPPEQQPDNDQLPAVHQSGHKPASGFDKSEWWRAPEFVPRGRTVQLSSDGSYVTQQQIPSSLTASQHGQSFNSVVCGDSRTTSQIPFVPPSSKTAHLVDPRIAQPPPAFPVLPAAGIPRGPGALIPVPLAPGGGWQMAALQAQLARVYAHNPRVARGHATAYHNHKLQQLILQQHQHQFHQRHNHRPPLIPTPIRPVAGPGAGIPTGYTANVTTIDTGLGRQIPAIVLKRKRKKKSKKQVEAKQQQAAADRKEESEQRADAGTDTSTEPKWEKEGKRETSPLDEDEADDIGRSEPDLTKLQHESGAVCDVLIGTAGEHLAQHGCYYPNDLDLIQSANCAMITGSCPDLSADSEVIDNRSDGVSIMSKSNHANPFSRDGDDRSAITDGLSQSAYGEEDFDLDTNPAVRSVMKDLASDGMIRSRRVKELNRRVIEDMRLEEKVKEWKREDWSEPELDEDDTIFERLLKNEDARKEQETNPGRGQKSLREEMEEGLMSFGDGRALVHSAIVHSPHGPGATATTELFDKRDASASSRRSNSLIPRATFVEEDAEEERMRITVNAIDALDVDGPHSVMADSPRPRPQRRYSLPDAAPLRSRACCAIM